MITKFETQLEISSLVNITGLCEKPIQLLWDGDRTQTMTTVDGQDISIAATLKITDSFITEDQLAEIDKECSQLIVNTVKELINTAQTEGINVNDYENDIAIGFALHYDDYMYRRAFINHNEFIDNDNPLRSYYRDIVCEDYPSGNMLINHVLREIIISSIRKTFYESIKPRLENMVISADITDADIISDYLVFSNKPDLKKIDDIIKDFDTYVIRHKTAKDFDRSTAKIERSKISKLINEHMLSKLQRRP
jgi:hypothetical protein